MENNENNVQNQEKKQSKGLSVGLVIIMLIAALIIGIGGGYLLSKTDNLFNKNETKSNNTDNKTEENNTFSINEYLNKKYYSKGYSYIELKNIHDKDVNFIIYEYVNTQNITFNGNGKLIDNKIEFEIKELQNKGYLTFDKDKIIMNITEGSNQCFSAPEKIEYIKKEVDEIKKIEYEEGMYQISLALQDKEWVKNNVSLEYGNTYPENEPQKHTFIVMKDSSDVPTIIVKAQRQSTIGTMQAYIVTFKNNTVIAEEIAKDYRISASGDNTDIKVDPNNSLVDYYSDLGNGYENMIYSVMNANSKELDIYGYYQGGEHEGTWYFKEHHWRGVPTITEEEYNTIKNKYQSFKFISITTELTPENIDTYIK